MTDDELDRILRATRPHTAADDGFARSPAGAEALAAVHAAAAPPSSTSPVLRSLRRVRPFGLGIGFAAAAAPIVGIGVAMPGTNHSGRTPLLSPPSSGSRGGPPPGGPPPAHLARVGGDTPPGPHQPRWHSSGTTPARACSRTSASTRPRTSPRGG